jgi:predicted permease
MDNLTQDMRHALRSLAKAPGFTLVVVLTLALGIGANTAIFTLMDQVLLKALPVKDPERLVVLDAPGPNQGSTHNNSAVLTPISHPMFVDLRDKATVFDSVLAHYTVSVHLGVQGQTEQVDGDLVSGTFFEVLGVEPAVGRLFTAEDDRTPGRHPLVVLSHGFWQRRFAADPRIVGQSVSINGQPLTVIGVSAPGFYGTEVGMPLDVFIPLAMQPIVVPTFSADTLQNRRVRWLTPMARLKDGVSREEAAAGVNVLYRQILEDELRQMTSTRSERFRREFVKNQLTLLPGGRGTSELRGQSQTTLLVLMGMVGLVLLIACANVANLLLTRATSRQKEVAVRLALGASRGRLVRQLLVESLALSLLGGAAGLLVSFWTADVLIRADPGGSAARVFTAQPDFRVAGFAFGLSLLTGIVFGLAPAFQSTRPDVFPTLKSESGSVVGGTRPFRFRKGLVVAQVALSLLLLVGAGLFTRSLYNLKHLDPGFEAHRLLTFAVDPSLNGYDEVRQNALFKQIQDDIAAEPGVRSVSFLNIGLMTSSNWSSTVKVEGYEAKEDENMNPNMLAVGPGLFRTLGITLVSGRDFTDADVKGAPKVAVVNETFARYFFKDGDPIGRRFGFGRIKDGMGLDITIVGLVRDGKIASLKEEAKRYVYFPYGQQTSLGQMTYYVRAGAATDVLASRLRKIVSSVDASLPVTNLKTMEAQIGESLLVERLVAALSAAFGLLATLLAGLGLYGVMSYAVTLRTREIGIRMALGAEGSQVLRLVLHEVSLLTAVGVAVGLPGGYGLGRIIESQLFGLTARDPFTFAVATATLLTAALLAGYIPAARAARVDPMVALRYE